jgi:uroporphyrinogen-III decarboxylase
VTVDEAAAEAKDAVTATGGTHMMVGPGCVIPINTPAENIAAVFAAVRGED